MDLATRVRQLKHRGLSAVAVAAILDLETADVIALLDDPEAPVSPAGGGTVLHLGEGGFEPLNGWTDAQYGSVPTKLVRVGPIAMIYGVLYAPADFDPTLAPFPGYAHVLKLPPAYGDDNFSVSRPVDSGGEVIGNAYVQLSGGETHFIVLGLPSAAERPGLVNGDGLPLNFMWPVADPA